MLKIVASRSGLLVMAKDSHTINLLPSKGESLVSQFLNWALTIGRLLIILTETLALGTFLYRFSLDMRIVDLHDQIKAKSAIVQNFKPYEDTYRNMQDRLALAKQYDEASKIAPNVFRDLIEMGRGIVTFRTILIADNAVKMEVQAPSSTNVSTFVNAVKQYPEVVSVSIDKVENKTANANVTVGLTAQLKAHGPKIEEEPAQPVQQQQEEGGQP